MTFLSRASAFILAPLLVLAPACGDDDDASGGDDGKGSSTADAGGAGRGGGSGRESGNDDETCALGCELTLDAACAMGPDTQSECESDCERLRGGECGTQYRAYMACGDGEKVSCDAMGFPTVAACSSERAAFVDCLN